MENHQREYFVSQIIYGAKIMDFRGKTLIVQPLTIEQNYLANRVFKKVYDEALLSGIYTRNEMLEIMIEQGVWSQEDEDQIEKNKRLIEDTKLEIYKSFFNEPKKAKLKEKLERFKKDQHLLLGRKHANDQNDCEGIATYARWNWIIENTTYDENGNKYDFSDIGVALVLRKYNSETLEIEQFRELARTDPWRSMWFTSQSPESLFNRRTSELSSDQLGIISWSRLYDSVEDDDALDGWLIEQRRKREKDKNKFKLDGYDDKHQGADEVYIMASSEEEAAEVYSMNDAEGRMTVRSRAKTVKEADGDLVNHRDFRDMKIKALNEANAKFGK
jgi:hypothetical protein